MTRIEAFNKINRYNYLVGRKVGQDSIAAIMPIPIDPNITVEQIFTSIFNDLPIDKTFSKFSKFKIAVIFNYQKFLDHGEVIWKDLDQVLTMLDIRE
ncbi:hypothetical protein CPT03_03275 [Pedobacter ginsengisoli]|uniref:Uncharacterized protein n=1 Tax=Pedobacter ginsengisoli TaxID=363852 RepID=A0A2D1U1R4_9SPHI|nr:hypothetical protein [Pedobacter ginsengisoli]ATP55552.1 hypothetical protein CPT03_03275 [Pedobacter ginsengisoli]